MYFLISESDWAEKFEAMDVGAVENRRRAEHVRWLASSLPGMIEDAASVPALKAEITALSRADFIVGDGDEFATRADDLQSVADDHGQPGEVVEVEASHELENHFIAIIPEAWNDEGEVTHCDYKLFADAEQAYAAIESAATARKASLENSDTARLSPGETRNG